MDVTVRRGIQGWRFVGLVHSAESFETEITLHRTRVLTWCLATSAGRTGTKRRAGAGEFTKLFHSYLFERDDDRWAFFSLCSHQRIFRINFIYYQIKWLVYVWLYLPNVPLKLVLICRFTSAAVQRRHNDVSHSCRLPHRMVWISRLVRLNSSLFTPHLQNKIFHQRVVAIWRKRNQMEPVLQLGKKKPYFHDWFNSSLVLVSLLFLSALFSCQSESQQRERRSRFVQLVGGNPCEWNEI